ncbi:acyl-CoA dehydrogenase family protein [Histidinibacterium lentulum]|uniref:Acyl-CoA dehydrogenase n=1 Tax=Histidinibacterium lentulum TaxID=2480588 RepID=A0A3N2R5A8_9RHOB|nr:acyl-CoA dehydrogenase family protein [Histidinibacterium lentulum]ROU02551.1 acyl-CoA dehydrogenase [Histidinibacterium lentulum]
MSYRAPVKDTLFLLRHVADYGAVAATGRFAAADLGMVEAALAEAGRLSEDILAPLQTIGDRTPPRLDEAGVVMPPGYAEAWTRVAGGGWIGLAADPAHGGQGLPGTLAAAITEMISGACLSFAIAPLMSQSQIEALETHADDALKAQVLPRLISGDWAATMNLTEPQAGSDVGAVRTRAEPLGDGLYAVTGQKQWISYGDHDMTANICHLVLARLPDAPAGTRGLSLFLVLKILPDGSRNAVAATSLEHKMGQHGAPTCVMSFEGAKGWLVGAPHGGMAAMFTMMNNARLGVAMQGVGVASAALDRARAFAGERVQGGAPIEAHPDVRRMLAEMEADVLAARAIGLMCAVSADMALATGEAAHAARAGVLTPLAKIFGTETGSRVADLGIQVHGGAGYVSDTGAEQYLRDIRVTEIYEGTTGIQALDLVGRKMQDGGAAVLALIEEICDGAEAARASLPDLADPVYEAAENLRDATDRLLEAPAEYRRAAAVPFARGFARVLGAHAHLAAARAGDADRRALAEAYVGLLLPEHAAQLAAASAAGHLLITSPGKDAAA